MLPQAGARFRLAGEARKCIDQGTVFRWFLIEELADAAQRTEWKDKDIDEQSKWKCNHPPQSFEEFSHFCWDQIRWVYRLVDLPLTFGWRQRGFWDRCVGQWHSAAPFPFLLLPCWPPASSCAADFEAQWKSSERSSSCRSASTG